MKPFAKLLMAAALAAGFAAPARADVIYSNPAQLPTTGWFGYSASVAQGQYLASSFVPAGGGTVTDATWVGSVWPGWPQNTSFTLTLLDSIAGAGNVIATRSVTATATDLGTTNSAGFEVYSYAASFASFALTASTQYYFSIEGTEHWLWGDGSDAAAISWFSYSNDPTWQFPTGPGRAFDLLGTLDTASTDISVPEPGALALFGVALAGLGALRRRRTA